MVLVEPVFHEYTFVATGIFIVIECFRWGIHTWVLAYVIHWNFVAFMTFLLARVFKIKNRFIYLAFTIVVTIAFGVLTTAIDAFFAVARVNTSFGYAFSVIYMRGIYFYIVHVVGNAAFNIVLFAPMRTFIDKLMIKYYGRNVFLKEEDAATAIKRAERAEVPPSELTENAESGKIDKVADASQTSEDARANNSKR